MEEIKDSASTPALRRVRLIPLWREVAISSGFAIDRFPRGQVDGNWNAPEFVEKLRLAERLEMFAVGVATLTLQDVVRSESNPLAVFAKECAAGVYPPEEIGERAGKALQAARKVAAQHEENPPADGADFPPTEETQG